MELGSFTNRSLVERLFAVSLWALASLSLEAAVVPARTPLEIRMSAPTGTRISHAGDRVDATVIAPVYAGRQLVIPQGTLISGSIGQVNRLGYGWKHVTSEMDYRFDRLQFPDGTEAAIQADVTQVEEGKERVSEEGAVKGIQPTANISVPIVSYLYPLALAEPHFGLPFLAIKLVIARSPDPEIYLPAGTEMVLRLRSAAEVPEPASGAEPVAKLTANELAQAQGLLAQLPEQYTSRGRNHPSDLINVMILGDRAAIGRAFQAAGWAGAQSSSLRSIYRMYHSMVQRMGYSTAPMVKLTLNGASADDDYQKSLDTFSKRHHIRLWKQGGGDVWLGAATEDVNFAVRDMHLTHTTDPAIDNERNKVLNDLALTGCLEGGAMVARTMADRGENSIETDGGLAVVRLNDCRHPQAAAEQTLEWHLRPRPKAVQILVAIRNDAIWNNPAFLLYNGVKSLCVRRANEGARMSFLGQSRRDKQDAAESRAGTAWTRPSVLDLQPQAN